MRHASAVSEFERSDGGRPHGGDMSPLLEQTGHRSAPYLEMLGMHRMPGRIVVLHRKEGSRPDVKRHLLEAEAAPRIDSISSGVKCSPAVGAATEPSNFE